MERIVITVNRQYGSMGGKVSTEIGKKLGIKVYDDEIIDLASKKSGIRKDYFYQAQRLAGISANESLLYSLVNKVNDLENQELLESKDLMKRIFRVQSQVIEELAASESCVLMDHAAGYVLRHKKNHIRVMTCAAIDYRVQMAMDMLGYSREKAVAHIREIDGERKTYFERYAHMQWDNPENYELCLNIKNIGIEESANIVSNYIKDLS